MRVLTVGNLYPPHHFGGYEQVWWSAVKHLRSRGHDVRVLATGHRHEGVADAAEQDIHRDLRWYWSDHEFTPLSLRERIRLERHNQRQLSHQLTAFQPDIVSFWSMGGMSHSLIETTRRRDLPIAAFVHDEWLDYGRSFDQWGRIFAPDYMRPLGRVAAAFTGLPTHVDYGGAGRFVFVSEFIRRRARALPFALPDTAVAPSGIDPLFLQRGPEHPWGWQLLYVGRLHPDKGIQDAVAALAELPADATLTFAGTWVAREEDALAQQVAQLGLQSQVRMLGRQRPEQVADLYRRHDVLLFPVRWEEPWGLVPLESLAAGCPVIATGRGGSAEYLRDEDNCLLVAVRDPTAIAAAVRRLAASPALRNRLRTGGFETAPRYTDEVFNTAVERHLADVAQRTGAEVHAAEPGEPGNGC